MEISGKVTKRETRSGTYEGNPYDYDLLTVQTDWDTFLVKVKAHHRQSVEGVQRGSTVSVEVDVNPSVKFDFVSLNAPKPAAVPARSA